MAVSVSTLAPRALGCGRYDVYFRLRCGLYLDNEVGQVAGQQQLKCRARDVTDITFNRRLNEISEAQVTIGLRGDDPDCCECLSDLDPWRHELVIYRDGDEVWTGPVTDVDLNTAAGSATVYAKDLMAWTEHRVVEPADDYEPEDIDLKDAFEWVLNHAYCKDPWCMTWQFSATHVPVSRYYPRAIEPPSYRGGQYPNCLNELRQLTTEGVDWTVIVRHLWGGSVQISNPIAQSVILLDQHWAEAPSVRVAGAEMGNRQIVGGGSGGYDGWYEDQIAVQPSTIVQIPPVSPANLTAEQRTHGLLESFSPESHLEDEDTSIQPNAIDQNAWSRYQLRVRPHVYVTGGYLAQNAPVSFDVLIPGASIIIRLAQICRPLTRNNYRLQDVSVSVGADAVERVSVKLVPLAVESVYSGV